MISLHSSMHSSQMYTPGPEISLSTCFRDLPQEAHLETSPPSPVIALHSSMHSSQLYPPGPEISLSTCFWDLPQKEHLNTSAPSPVRAMSVSSHRSDFVFAGALLRPILPSGTSLAVRGSTLPRRSSAPWEAGRRGDRRRGPGPVRRNG